MLMIMKINPNCWDTSSAREMVPASNQHRRLWKGRPRQPDLSAARDHFSPVRCGSQSSIDPIFADKSSAVRKRLDATPGVVPFVG